MNLELRYGTGTVRAKFKPPRKLENLMPRRIATLQSPGEIIEMAMSKPIGSHPFEEVFKSAGKVLIVVPDDLHQTGGSHYLPYLIRKLNGIGVPSAEVTILVAGPWGAKRNGVGELLEGEPKSRPRIIYHDIHDADRIEYVGQTSRGTPVFVNRALLDAEMVLLCGTMRHDTFAGYSGGPNMILPCCAGLETIEYNLLHSVSSRAQQLHPNCHAGRNRGNPLQQDRREAFRFITINFLLHTILNASGQMIGAVAGEPLQAHSAGCRIVDDLYRITVQSRADAAIVSCGGSPYDATLSDAHRALHNACAVVRPGGTIILVAACERGWGDHQLRRMAEGEDAHRDPIDRHGYRRQRDSLLTVSFRQKAEERNIILVSDLESRLVSNLGLIPADDLDHALQQFHDSNPDQNLCFLIPEGHSTVPVLA